MFYFIHNFMTSVFRLKRFIFYLIRHQRVFFFFLLKPSKPSWQHLTLKSNESSSFSSLAVSGRPPCGTMRGGLIKSQSWCWPLIEVKGHGWRVPDGASRLAERCECWRRQRSWLGEGGVMDMQQEKVECGWLNASRETHTQREWQILSRTNTCREFK